MEHKEDEFKYFLGGMVTDQHPEEEVDPYGFLELFGKTAWEEATQKKQLEFVSALLDSFLSQHWEKMTDKMRDKWRRLLLDACVRKKFTSKYFKIPIKHLREKYGLWSDWLGKFLS